VAIILQVKQKKQFISECENRTRFLCCLSLRRKGHPSGGIHAPWYLPSEIAEGVLLNPLIDSAKYIVGVLFHFHGYRFLLYLEEEGLQPNIPIPSMFGEKAHNTQTLYQPQALNFNLGKYLSHVIAFAYQD
jgi:hypothetical protein